jgi:hypothetical protein
MRKYLKISALFILTFFAFSLNAQIGKIKKTKNFNSKNSAFKGCKTSLASKKGEVYSVSPAFITTKATSNKVTVKVKKTGGRAKTTVNIYVNNILQQDKRIIFETGKDKTPFIERDLYGVKGKIIKVEIVNQSVGNTFKYIAKIIGKSKNLIKGGKPVSGTLIGQASKNVFTNKSCTQKTKIIVKRTGGNARGTIRIYEFTGNGNYTRLLKSETFESNQNKKEFLMNSSKKLKIEVKNISVGKLLKYKINAIAVK